MQDSIHKLTPCKCGHMSPRGCPFCDEPGCDNVYIYDDGADADKRKKEREYWRFNRGRVTTNREEESYARA